MVLKNFGRLKKPVILTMQTLIFIFVLPRLSKLALLQIKSKKLQKGYFPEKL